MALDRILKSLFSQLLHKKVVSIGTKYYATNDLETEYVSLKNTMQTCYVHRKVIFIHFTSCLRISTLMFVKE